MLKSEIDIIENFIVSIATLIFLTAKMFQRDNTNILWEEKILLIDRDVTKLDGKRLKSLIS